MLDVNFEFVRGILFVRLEGKINHDSTSSVKNSLTEIIKKGGIKYLVFNVSNAVLEERVSLFDDCNEQIKNNGGKMYMCGLNSKLENIISNNIDNVTNTIDEISVLRMISVC